MEKAIGHIPETVVETLKRGTNYFFGIGINKYQNYSQLNNAVKDVTDFGNLLLQNYYFEQKNIRFLMDEEATRENIIEELDGFRNILKNDDRILIYYSGHGYMDGELGFWVPVDAKRERKSSLVNNSEVQAIIRTIKARHILLISDSCYSGSLMVRGTSRSTEGAFVDFERNPSRYVFTSGKGEVMDGKSGENSPFADAILKNLKSNEDAINILLLADQVTKRVSFNYEQKAECAPMYQSGHDGGQFVFFKRQTEKDRWESSLNQNVESAYLKYLNEFPDGQYVTQAEQNLRDLSDEKAWNLATMYDSASSYRDYLRKYPQGKHNVEAHTYIENVLDNANKDERDRLAKIEAEKKIETARIERERLDKIEADKIQQEIAAKSEKENIERARLAKIFTDRIERERLDKIETDKRIEADRIDRERLEKIEADNKIEANRIERERLAKIKAEKNIEADKIKHQRLDNISMGQQSQKYVIPETLPAKKNYTIAILGGVVVVGFIMIWFLSRPSQTTTISTPVENTTQQNPISNNNVYSPPQQTTYATPPSSGSEIQKIGGVVINPAKKKPKSTASDDAPTTDNYSISSGNDIHVQERKNLSKVISYLSSALTLIDSNNYTDASNALDNALKTITLFENNKTVAGLSILYINNDIQEAKISIQNYNYVDAKISIAKTKADLIKIYKAGSK